MTREIPLTRGLVALVDDADYEAVVALGSWSATSERPSRCTYARKGFRGKPQLLLHSFLAGFPLTDHINGNGLDNRRANLRPATGSQNSYNSRLPCTNKSGYKGVSWHKSSNQWRAQIRVGGKPRTLGYFRDPAEAALAYDVAAREVAGAFACVNFPLPGERGAAA